MSYGAPPAVTTVLHGVDLAVAPGEFVAIVGSSGSGKSTLLNLLGLLEKPTAGKILVGGVPATECSPRELARLRNRALGYVFQSFNLLAGLTVLENVMLPTLIGGLPRGQSRSRAVQLLERVELAGLERRYPAELSGGQQQRVAIARSLIMEPAVLLADEPTGNLDSRSSAIVMNLLYSLHAEGQTLVLVTHDDAIARAAPRLVRIEDGRIVSDGRPKPPPAAPSAQPSPLRRLRAHLESWFDQRTAASRWNPAQRGPGRSRIGGEPRDDAAGR